MDAFALRMLVGKRYFRTTWRGRSWGLRVSQEVRPHWVSRLLQGVTGQGNNHRVEVKAAWYQNLGQHHAIRLPGSVWNNKVMSCQCHLGQKMRPIIWKCCVYITTQRHAILHNSRRRHACTVADQASWLKTDRLYGKCFLALLNSLKMLFPFTC